MLLLSLLNSPIELFLFCVFAFLLYQILWQYYVWFRLPPGPFPLPLFGNYFLLRNRGKTRIMDLTMQLAEKYGDPCTVWFGLTPVVFFHSPEVNLEAMGDKNHDFASRPDLVLGNIHMETYQDIVFSGYTEKWKTHRKTTNRAFRKIVDSSRIEDTMQDLCLEMVDMIHEDAKQNAERAITLRPYTAFVSYSAIVAFAFGRRLQFHGNDYRLFMKIQAENNQYANPMTRLEFVPFVRSLYPTALLRVARRTKQIVGIFKDYVRDAMQEHLQEYNADMTAPDREPRDILEALLQDRSGGKAAYLQNGDIEVSLLNMFMAGTDGVSITIRWLILEMILHPEIQERIHQELMSVTDGGARLPSLTDRPNTPFLEATCMETLRRFPPATLGVPHAAVKSGARLGSYTYPKQAMLVTNMHGLHHDPRYYHNPFVFNPDRFIDSETSTVAKPWFWLPFGFGKRVCMGDAMAKNELYLLAAIFLLKLKFLPVSGEHYSEKLASFSEFNVLPAKNYRYVVESRGA